MQNARKPSLGEGATMRRVVETVVGDIPECLRQEAIQVVIGDVAAIHTRYGSRLPPWLSELLGDDPRPESF